MDPFDALVLIAELALGIAGFSGVIVALGARPGIWPRVDRLRLATLLVASLGALFFALLALTLMSFDVSVARIWRVSNIGVAAVILFMLVAIVPGAWSITRQTTGLTSSYSIAVFIPIVAIAAATAIVQIASAFGLVSLNPFGVLFKGLAILLLISGVQFVRLLFMVRGEADTDDSNTE